MGFKSIELRRAYAKEYYKKYNASEKMKSYFRKYRLLHRDKINKRQVEYKSKDRKKWALLKKQWYLKNREKAKAYSKKYYYSNKEYAKNYIKTHREQRKKYYLTKRQTNNLYRIEKNIRRLLLQKLEHKSFKKRGKTFGILKYTGVELMNHLEKQFTPEMSWNNYGSYWVIDHKYPVSNANSYEEVVKLFELNNLQPLEKRENAIKSNKIIADLFGLNFEVN